MGSAIRLGEDDQNIRKLKAFHVPGRLGLRTDKGLVRWGIVN
jgi:hypothetical protein